MSTVTNTPDLNLTLRLGMSVSKAAADDFDYNRSLGDGYEELGVKLWQSMFPRIEEAKRKLEGEYVAVVEDRSSLKLDDRYLGAWRGGGLHVTAMNAALDALLTLRFILEAGQLPMTALYPLLRSAIENASLALYMLAPNDRDTRLTRSFQVADDDAKYRSAFAATLGKSDTTNRTGTTAEIRALIKLRRGLGAAGPVSLTLPGHTQIVTLADAAIAADPAAAPESSMPLLAWWQLLSGMSHAKQWALIAGLERSGAIVDTDNESAHVKMTSSTVVIGLALQRSVEALEAALRLYGRRSKGAWAQPEDASEPATHARAQLGTAPAVPIAPGNGSTS